MSIQNFYLPAQTNCLKRSNPFPEPSVVNKKMKKNSDVSIVTFKIKPIRNHQPFLKQNFQDHTQSLIKNNFAAYTNAMNQQSKIQNWTFESYKNNSTPKIPPSSFNNDNKFKGRKELKRALTEPSRGTSLSSFQETYPNVKPILPSFKELMESIGK